jgi:hypothetical protein
VFNTTLMPYREVHQCAIDICSASCIRSHAAYARGPRTVGHLEAGRCGSAFSHGVSAVQRPSLALSLSRGAISYGPYVVARESCHVVAISFRDMTADQYCWKCMRQWSEMISKSRRPSAKRLSHLE